MSIGFIGSNSSQRTVDVYSGGANRTVEISLQNVLNKYDKIKTDLDRLVDQSQFNTYDITSRQHYNSYNKEAINGWAESWYAEYRAVLALRADALQKKLQASYNRVLERSAYAEIKPDKESTFAPYANRTYKDSETTNLNNKMRVANVLMVDESIGISAPSSSPPPLYTPLWFNGTNLKVGDITSYLANTDGINISGSGSSPWALRNAAGLLTYKYATDATSTGRETNAHYHGYSDGNGQPSADPPDWRANMADGPLPVNYNQSTSNNDYGWGANQWQPKAVFISAGAKKARDDQRDSVLLGIQDGFIGWVPPVQPLPGSYPNGATDPGYIDAMLEWTQKMSEYNSAKDDAVESALRSADELWKGAVSADGSSDTSKGDADVIADDYRDVLTADTFRKAVADTVKGFKPAPWPPALPSASGSPSGYDDAYERLKNITSDSSGQSESYQGMGDANYRKLAPQFGVGDLLSYFPANVRDTIDGTTLLNLTANLNNLSRSFVGTQYENAYKGNKYGVKPNASSISVMAFGTLLGIGQDGSPNPDTNGLVSANGAYLRLPLNIDTGQNSILDIINNVDANFEGGSILSAGAGGIATAGFGVDIPITLVPLPVDLHIYAGGQATIGPDLFFGHTSALSNLSSTKVGTDLGLGGIAGAAIKLISPAFIPSVTALPTMGLGSGTVYVGVGLGPVGVDAPLAAGVMITVNFSYDFLADAMTQILKKLKTFMVEAMSVNSYAASSGVAMDSYASRAEYHFTGPGFAEAMEAMNFVLEPIPGVRIPINLGDILKKVMFDGIPTTPLIDFKALLGVGALSTKDDIATNTNSVNGQTVGERLFNYKHGVQGAETRETETGAFFATNAFLGQFELNNMESEYWIGTQQNEELFNADLGRSMTTVGSEVIKSLVATMASVSGANKDKGFMSGATSAILSGVMDKELTNIMFDLMYRDQRGAGSDVSTSAPGLLGAALAIATADSKGNGVGLKNTTINQSTGPSKVIGARIPISKSSFSSEAYDYIENDHKPFEGDSDFNYKQAGLINAIPLIGPILGSGMDMLFAASTPDFILDGMANTRRFTSTDNDNDIRIQDVKDATNPLKMEESRGLGVRANIGRGSFSGGAGDNSPITSTPDGIYWADTGKVIDKNGKTDLNGDINEVYVGTRKVKFSNLSMGFGEFSNTDLKPAAGATITSTAAIKNRDQDKNNLAATAKTGQNAGTITETNNTGLVDSKLGALRATTAKVERFVGIDSRINERRNDGASPVDHETFTSNMYTSNQTGETRKYYDRRNQYSLAFDTKADTNNKFSLFGSQALNPTIGGYLKMAVIDKNKTDDFLIAHDNGGINAVRALGSAVASDANVQKFGGTAEGELNELNETLYEHMHLRADGRNLSTIKEYRDVFETGLMKNIFISGQTYHPSGGGITSSIEIKYNSAAGKSSIQSNTRENYDASSVYFDPYNTPFLTKSRGETTVILNSYFAYKKRATNSKT